MTTIIILIIINKQSIRHNNDNNSSVFKCGFVRPISVLRFAISEGSTQAES